MFEENAVESRGSSALDPLCRNDHKQSSSPSQAAAEKIHSPCLQNHKRSRSCDENDGAELLTKDTRIKRKRGQFNGTHSVNLG
jgi:hypothetical protein